MTGALAGLRIIEMAGIGPGPFCGMMLADHGAEVIRVERPGPSSPGLAGDPLKDPLLRSRRSLGIDLKSSAGVAVVRNLCATADGIIEGFRPGVMERLGLGPELLLKDNPRLVYGRMTGWGQTGPYAQAAGHDINYLALSGALHAMGRAGEKPTPPMNLVGDFGGGGMLLAFGMVSAILSARDTGLGQVVDCAMIDGASLLMSMIWGLYAAGQWSEKRGTNLLDTGAHFYESYECKDGGFLAVGAIEQYFYKELLNRTGSSYHADLKDQFDRDSWPALKEKMATMFATRTRDEWCELMAGTDACVTPVLAFHEVAKHPHNAARGATLILDGVEQPAPAPRMSRTPVSPSRPPVSPGSDTDGILLELGFDVEAIGALRRSGTIGCASAVQAPVDGMKLPSAKVTRDETLHPPDR